VIVGDWVARDIATEHPTKLAAIEGLAKTTRGASEHLLGWYTASGVKFGIEIPHLLSLLAFHSWNAKVQGLDAVPVAYRPPVNITRYSFQAMVGIGTGLAVLAVWFMWVRYRKRRLPDQRWFYLAASVAGAGALVALIAGWLVTEVGRQPWVVYKVMTAAQAVTKAGSVPVSYGVLASAYVLLAAALVWILRRLAKAPLDGPGDPLDVDGENRQLVGV
jgi:cytochrome d ubiquinol oxidase subunit I